MIGDGRPTEIDRGARERLFYSCRAFVCDWRRNDRRGDNHGFTANLWPGQLGGNIYVHVSFKPITLNRLTADCFQLIVIRTFVNNGRIVISDVRNVGRLINDGNIALGRQKRLLHSRRAKFATRDKAILVRTDIIITIRPVMNAGVLIETRFRGKWRPANVIVALAPGNPSWRPLIAGDPDPTNPA